MSSRFIEFFVTWGYLGKIRFMPGTFGSFGAFPILFLMHLYLPSNQFETQAAFILILLFIGVFLYASGAWAVARYLEMTNKKDPSEVVIDEVVGQLLASFIYVSFYWGMMRGGQVWVDRPPVIFGEQLYFIWSFIFFRIFDIIKIWPASYADTKMKGAHGVMMDDVFAGIQAGILLFALEYARRFYLGM